MKTSQVSVGVAAFGTAVISWLLYAGKLGDTAFVAALGVVAIASLAIFLSPRLKELSLKDLKIVLHEIEKAQEKLEKTKVEIAEMYGGIEALKKHPLILDESKMASLGLACNAIPQISAVMRYTAGCIKRERERLARIVINDQSPERVAQALLDGSYDEKVFKWNGPEVTLDAAPKSLEERGREKNAAPIPG